MEKEVGKTLEKYTGKQKSDTALREEEILARWRERGIFEKTLEQTKGGNPFVFYDGPPFATGLPHYGHILAGTIKDVIPRYRTMKGDFVRRVWGWDCHGLPIENMVEKELGLGHKKEIEELGIGKFNKVASDSVLRYDAEWKHIVPRMGRWIDMEHSYKTMDTPYTESVWWAFKTLYNKGLLYKGHKAMHLCPRCETTLANYEVSQGYKDITDISVTVKFPLAEEPNTYLLAWTTTPWTLPGNTALAVNPDVEYVKVKTAEEIFYIAKDRAGEVMKDASITSYDVVTMVKGSDLVGKSYIPPFDYYYKNSDIENRENGWKVYSAPFVTTDSGTGIVHIAPAFGEDDLELGRSARLPFVQHVRTDGTFAPAVTDFAGVPVKPKGEGSSDHQSADIEIIKYLAKRGVLFSKKKLIHSYPHCWRCDTPLLNYASSSWFVKVTDLKDRMIAENEKVSWVPESVGTGRFGKWLEGARDWAMSRSRYWGAPLPVWECTACEERVVLSSIADIKAKTTKGNTFFIMRHGESENNAQNIGNSREGTAYPLTEKGRAQAERGAEGLRASGIDMIVSSPLRRTRETAEIVARALGIPEQDITIDDRVREVELGDFNERPIAEYRAYFSSSEEKFNKPTPGEGGGTLRDLRARVMDFLYDMNAQYEGKNILVVTHEYSAWLMCAGAEGLSVPATSALKRTTGDNFLANAEVRPLAFAPIPHNDDWELDAHRPYIDDISFPCACGSIMRRIPEVFDCWFESGSMPFAQFHYPLHSKEDFERNFPADIIAEGLDQTRGWFYTMLALSVALFDKTPFRSVIVNGMVLAENGQKMSKRLSNYPDISHITDTYSADALRCYLLASPVVHGEDLRFSERGVDEIQKKIVMRLRNVLSFYEMHKGAGGASEYAPDSVIFTSVLDQWMIARLAETAEEVEKGLSAYTLDRAVRPLLPLVDDLSTWYVRRSRERFKGSAEEKTEALSALRFMLVECSKIFAPFMPFLAEDVYVRAGGPMESVHLEAWPSFEHVDRKSILTEMNGVRDAVSLVLEERMKVGIKVRQPLARATFARNTIISLFPNNKELLTILKDEINVKEISFSSGGGLMSPEVVLDTVITPELKREGDMRDLVRAVQDARKHAGLNPADSAVLSVSGSITPEAREFIQHAVPELSRLTNVAEIAFITDGTTGDPVPVGDYSLHLSVQKK